MSGSEHHDGSVDIARKRAVDAGVADRVAFELASATTFTGTGYDLVTSFDCLHDTGDPAGAARHVHDALADDGTWLLVEPAAGDTVADNVPRRAEVLLLPHPALRAERALAERRPRSGRRRAPRRGAGGPRGGLHPDPGDRADAVNDVYEIHR